jgi:hypothetical protein
VPSTYFSPLCSFLHICSLLTGCVMVVRTRERLIHIERSHSYNSRSPSPSYGDDASPPSAEEDASRQKGFSLFSSLPSPCLSVCPTARPLSLGFTKRADNRTLSIGADTLRYTLLLHSMQTVLFFLMPALPPPSTVVLCRSRAAAFSVGAPISITVVRACVGPLPTARHHR